MLKKEEILLNSYLNKMKELLIKKGNDYSGQQSTLYNFSKLKDLGINEEMSIFIRLSDKYNRLYNYLKTKKLEVNESIFDTLIDLANYSLLLILFLDTKRREKK